MISFAPAACKARAMPQAILRLLATPKTTAVRPSMLNDIREGSTRGEGNYREPTILMNFAGNEKRRALRLSQKPPDPLALPPLSAKPRTKTQTRKPPQSQQTHTLTQMHALHAPQPG